MMRSVGLLLLILSTCVVLIAKRETGTEQTYLEVPSARVKLPSELEKVDEKSTSFISWYAFLNRKAYRIETVGGTQARMRNGGGTLAFTEHLVPKEVPQSSVVDSIASSFMLLAISLDQITRSLAGIRDLHEYEYQVKSISETSDSFQYQVISLSSNRRERVIAWVALYWRSNRVVVLSYFQPFDASREDERRFEKLWAALNLSFEWKEHQK